MLNFLRCPNDVKFNLIIWATKKNKSLFKIKDNVKHAICVIYKGICSCGNNYVVETMRNTTTRIDKHEHAYGKSGRSKHLENKPGCKFKTKDS